MCLVKTMNIQAKNQNYPVKNEGAYLISKKLKDDGRADDDQRLGIRQDPRVMSAAELKGAPGIKSMEIR